MWELILRKRTLKKLQSREKQTSSSRLLACLSGRAENKKKLVAANKVGGQPTVSSSTNQPMSVADDSEVIIT